jgi:hypothetical protein
VSVALSFRLGYADQLDKGTEFKLPGWTESAIVTSKTERPNGTITLVFQAGPPALKGTLIVSPHEPIQIRI